MDKKISDIFDYGDEIVVALRGGEDCDPAEIKELTMKRIHNAYEREEAAGRVRKARPMYRTVLIAAVITALLLGTAFAVYRFTMRDVIIGERYNAEIDTGAADDGGRKFTQMELVRLSLNGLADSPEYRAYEEWTAWNDAWWAENPDPWASLGEDDSYHETPENYLYYNAYFPEQAEKLDEIAEKYGLTLHTSMANVGSAEELYDVLGVPEVFSDGFHVLGGYMYDDGSFKLDCELDDSFQKTAEVFCGVKGSFTLIGNNIPADYEEWAYTTADGTEVVPVMTEGVAYLVADTDGAFITICFGGVTDKAELERYADGVDFQALSERFADTDTSDIAAAVEVLRAEEAAAMEQELANMYAPFADKAERDAAVFAELGHYTITDLPEGYAFLYDSAEWKSDRSWMLWDMDQTGSAFTYGGSTWKGDGSDGIYRFLHLSYQRYYDRRDMETVTNDVEFENAKAFYQDNSGEFSETTVNGYDALIVRDVLGTPGSHDIIWFDTDIGLQFTLSEDSFAENAMVQLFTDEELIAMAESVAAR